MQVEINNEDSIVLPLLGHVIFGTDESCDYVFNNESSDNKKIFSIVYDKSACILEVFENNQILINEFPVNEMAILHPGDTVFYNNNKLKLINENNLPKACSTPFKLIQPQNFQDHLITAVSGLRSYNPDSYGVLSIVGEQNSYTHTPINDEDTPFSVSYINESLTLLCKKNYHIRINGNKASYVILKNGDYITTGSSKYCVESPGTSAFSKYSPSHPRNIQLSEEYYSDDTNAQQHQKSFLKSNLWWITLLIGLIIVAVILYILKNN